MFISYTRTYLLRKVPINKIKYSRTCRDSTWL